MRSSQRDKSRHLDSQNIKMQNKANSKKANEELICSYKLCIDIFVYRLLFLSFIYFVIKMMTFYQNRNLIIKGESEQCGNLWLGDYESARNKRQLKNDGIFTVLTAGLGMKISYTQDFKHKLLPLYDYDGEDIARFFHSIYPWIDESLKSGNLLIHCYAGVSRSTTIMASYLMKKNGWNSKETLALIKKGRPYIGPNKGFLRQLKRFENEMNNIPENQMDISERVMPGKEKQFLQKMRVETRTNNLVGGVMSYQKKVRQNSVLPRNNLELNLNMNKSENVGVSNPRSKTSYKYGSRNISKNI